MNNFFSSRLREARILRGISQTDLAVLVGIAPGQVNRYEAGKNTPRPHIIAKLAEGLKVNPRWLEHGEEPMTETINRRKTVTLTFTQDEYQQLQETAADMGLSVEDALPILLKEGAAELQRNLEERTPAPEGLEEIKRALSELQKRVEEIAKDSPNS